MFDATRSRATPDEPEDERSVPEISLYESGPGKTLYIESGNAAGWIEIDTSTTVDVLR